MIENKRGHRSFPFTYFWLEFSPDQVLGSVGNRKVYFIVNYCKFLCIHFFLLFIANSIKQGNNEALQIEDFLSELFPAHLATAFVCSFCTLFGLCAWCSSIISLWTMLGFTQFRVLTVIYGIASAVSGFFLECKISIYCYWSLLKEDLNANE